jgi:hypothetical protein
MQSPDPTKSPQVAPRKATLSQVASAVFWSFFGVRKKQDYDTDASSISATQAIVAGVIGAALLVIALLVLVNFVT